MNNNRNSRIQIIAKLCRDNDYATYRGHGSLYIKGYRNFQDFTTKLSYKNIYDITIKQYNPDKEVYHIFTL